MTPTGTAVEFLCGKVLDTAWSEATRLLLKKRLERAREILIDELSKGNISLQDIDDRDEAAAMVFEYADAAVRGTARRNLRLIAQVMAGSLTTPRIYADEFLRWSRIIADLTQDELITMAAFYKRHERKNDGFSGPITQLRTLIHWQFEQVVAELVASGVAKEEKDVRATLQALGRHGLVLQQPQDGMFVYSVGSNLEALMRLSDIEAVLQEPPRWGK